MGIYHMSGPERIGQVSFPTFLFKRSNGYQAFGEVYGTFVWDAAETALIPWSATAC